MSDHEEFRLAPLDDDEEIGLKPLDDEEEKIIAPDFPLDTNLRLMPVICSACRTRLYATEDQVGMWKICPDCLRKTEIRYVEPEFRVHIELDENGGYVVKEPEIQERPTSSIGVDYRTVDGYAKPKVIQERSFNDEQPKLESLLQSMLHSKEEKERIEREKQIETKIEEQMRIAKKKRNETVGGQTKVDDWKMDDIFASLQKPSSASPGAQKTPAQKQAPKETQQKRSIPRPPTLPASASSPGLKKVVPVPQRKTEEIRKTEQEAKISLQPVEKARQKSIEQIDGDFAEESTSFWLGFRKFFNPLLVPINRQKLIVLFVIGYLSNFFLEHVKSSLGRVFFDMHPDGPGQIISWAEMGFFSVSFFIGTFFGIIWLILVLMFGFSIFSSTAAGRIKVDRWIMFDLNLGFSYILWTVLIFYLSFYPGVFLIWGIDAVFPAFRGLDYIYPRLTIFYLGPFFVFPILFLCIMETDMFFKGWPRRTLGSLIVLPMLWVKFYLCVLIFSLVPFLFLGTLAYLNLVHYKNPWMQSIFYYPVAAFFETLLLGFFPLVYFRFLGRLSWVISQDYPEYEEE